MESIYYVMAWACHRKCRHCYEDRFRPYVRGDLARVVEEAQANAPRIVDSFPASMRYLDEDGATRTGRIILSGGECLLDAVRETVTYPTIERINARYLGAGGCKVVVQTTGDLLTPRILDELLERGVYMISIASTDRYHVGLDTPEKQAVFVEGLTRMFEAAGVRRAGPSSDGTRKWHEQEGPLFNVFGATDESWIGKIWPRGRGWANGLSTATLGDNFCNRWSGGLGFLRHGRAGSEVSVEPDGSVYPCCVKTRHPLGSLLDDDLLSILDSLRHEPAFQAIDRGVPDAMGEAYGWSRETFLERSRTTTPTGAAYANLCIGCDAFHDAVLGPVLEAAALRRAASRAAAEGKGRRPFGREAALTASS